MLLKLGLCCLLMAASSPNFAQTQQPVPPQPKEDDSASKSKNDPAGYFPNLILLTQDNKPVHFYEDLLKNNVVLINFFFTTCDSVCPAMTANLAKVQTSLGERVGKEVTMISISVDPLTDTPERLKQYATRFKVQPGWFFLTGKKENIDWVLYKLGGYVTDKNAHTSVLIMGNLRTNEWKKTFALAKVSQITHGVMELLK